MSKLCDALKLILQLLSYIPTLLIASLILWSYFVYLSIFIKNYVLPYQNFLLITVILLFYHLSITLLLITFFYSTTKKPIRIPNSYQINYEETQIYNSLNKYEEKAALLKEISLKRNFNLKTRDARGGVRFCKICYIIKPDRCHHCKLCGTCVLKMDHHCPWIANCVGHHNYKHFFLFLAYGWTYCCFLAIHVGPIYLPTFSDQNNSSLYEFQVFFLFVFASIFLLCLTILLGYHIYLAAKNKTTIESAYAPRFAPQYSQSHFNLTYRHNMIQIFGFLSFKAFLPIDTSLGDGLSFPTINDLPTWYHRQQIKKMPMLEDNENLLNSEID